MRPRCAIFVENQPRGTKIYHRRTGRNRRRRDNRDCDTSYRNKPPVKPIQPALWPLIFERAYETSDKPRGVGNKKCATGMFYMLRNGTGLQDIIAMSQQGKSEIRNSSSSNRPPPNVSSIATNNKRRRKR